MFGQWFAGELFLLLLMPLLLYDRFYRQSTLVKERQAWLWIPIGALLLSLLITFVGYFVADLYRNNTPEDFLRGWARIIFLGVGLLGVAMLVSVQRANFWLLVLGYGVGGVLILALRQMPLSNWKLGYAEPTAAVVVVMVCLVKSMFWRTALLSVFAVVNIWLDYRSAAGFIAVVTMLLWINHWSRAQGGRLVGIVCATVILVGAIGGAYYATQGDFAARRNASNSGRLSNAIVGFSAILESPLIGYGSWGRDARFAKLYADVNFRMNKTEENPLYNFDAIRLATIPAHSQFLESWIEGGMLGITFFLCYFFWLMRGLRVLVTRVQDVVLLPLLGYCMISGLWALFMSPFKGSTRFGIVLACLAAIIAYRLAFEGRKGDGRSHETAKT